MFGQVGNFYYFYKVNDTTHIKTQRKSSKRYNRKRTNIYIMGTIEERILLSQNYKLEHMLSLANDAYQQKCSDNFSANKLKTEKSVKDLLNKYKSHLQQQTQSKLDRTPNFKYETELQAKISVLNELKSKL